MGKTYNNSSEDRYTPRHNKGKEKTKTPKKNKDSDNTEMSDKNWFAAVQDYNL